VPDPLTGSYMICPCCGAGFDAPAVAPMQLPGIVSPDGRHIRCLHCGYTLTGLLENKCPECGRRFDPDYLLKLQHGDGLPTSGEKIFSMLSLGVVILLLFVVAGLLLG